MKNKCLVTIVFFLHLALSAQKFDHGNNRNYIPYQSFATSVAKRTPLNAAPPLTGYISNLETNVATKPVEGATSGVHFPKGTEGVQTVRYDLYVTDTIVDFTGKVKAAIAVNGKYPAPTMFATIGDTLLVYVHNKSKEPTAVHWHGVQLPERMDGVPFLTQQPIPPESTYVYKFPVVQAGTYWYHSHYALQEQIGLYGTLIFNKRTEPEIPTIPVILSDWSDTHPHEIDRMLHTGNDWFAIKKGASQSYWEALKVGKLKTKVTNEWKRMGAMDVSDVYYEKFFMNGETAQRFSQFKAGDRIRLRVVNGGASSYFWLNYSGGKITVVANDGNDVEPVEVDRLIISPSETYDLVVTIPKNMQYEFLATAEDRSGAASLWLGSGMEMPAMPLPKLKYFEGMQMMNDMMKMNGDMEPMGMEMSLQTMDMNAVMYPEKDQENHAMDGMNHSEHHSSTSELVTLNYDMLQATEVTTLPEGSWKTLKFELNGNMNRYVWSLNGKVVSESDKILIKKGENVRIILYNNSMMRHPMHLHGHDFRVVNQHSERSPLKNVIDIMPMETDTLEFRASESGDWFFHCHILYHMMSGMGRIFTYENSERNPEVPHPEMDFKMLKSDDQMYHLSFQNDFANNGNDGFVTYENTRWAFQGEWRLGYNADDGYEMETHFGRYFGNMQWLFPYAGVDWRYRRNSAYEKNLFGQQDTKDGRVVFHIGAQYTLPMLLVLDARMDHTGNVRMQLSRDDIPLTSRLRAAFMLNTDKEWMIGGRYILTKNLGVSTHYDSDMGWGIGMTFTY